MWCRMRNIYTTNWPVQRNISKNCDLHNYMKGQTFNDIYYYQMRCRATDFKSIDYTNRSLGYKPELRFNLQTMLNDKK